VSKRARTHRRWPLFPRRNHFSSSPGTNDGDGDAAWEAAFVATYVAFMRNITRWVGKSDIVFLCAVGAITDRPLPLVERAMAAAPELTTVLVNMMGAALDGCGHPGVVGQPQMAAIALPIVAKATGWSHRPLPSPCTSGTWGAALPGYLPAGNDVRPSGDFTLAAAQLLCEQTESCQGITFQAASAAPTGTIAGVSFKDVADKVDAAGWWSYSYCR
jgi:hypothetical protein